MFFCRMIWSSLATIQYVLSRNIIHIGPKKGPTSYGGAARSRPSMWLHLSGKRHFPRNFLCPHRHESDTIRKTNAANENNVGWWRGEDRSRYVWKKRICILVCGHLSWKLAGIPCDLVRWYVIRITWSLACTVPYQHHWFFNIRWNSSIEMDGVFSGLEKVGLLRVLVFQMCVIPTAT